MSFSERELAALRTLAKAELRRRMRTVRRVLPETARAARSALACDRLGALPELARARAILGYQAFRQEIDPMAALQRARALGCRIVLPRVAGGSLALHEHEPGAALAESRYGILEPLVSAPEVKPHEIDLVLVPALALDPSGHRIGYGKGFYDRLLPSLTRAFSVGLIYDFQLVAEIPAEAHDAPVACVVTDARVIRPSR